MESSYRNLWIRTVIRQRTKVTDIAHHISMLKWHLAGHISRRIDNRWGKQVLEWRPRFVKRSVGRPQARWNGCWQEMDASSRGSSEMARNWRDLCPAVDCSGRMMMMDAYMSRGHLKDTSSPLKTPHTEFHLENLGRSLT
jgi:hypothetical protein